MKIQLSDHFTYKKLLCFCFFPIIMMIFTSVYVVVDGFFVSNFVGKIPFAAINLVYPFIQMIGSIGFMVGTGGSALVAKTLGEGKDEQANRYFTMMVKLTLLLGIVLSIIGCVFIRPVSLLLGATDAMINDCVVYGRMILLFTTAFMLQNVFQIFLSTAGKPKLGFVVTVVAGLVNILLDALFIVVFKWGVFGAAVATGIGQCVGGVLPLVYFIRPNSSYLRLTRTKMERKAIRKACVNGSSEFVSNVSSSLISVLFNLQLLKFAGENGVAAYGTLMYVNFIFIAIFIGYTIGTAPIIGYHYGAAHYGELKSLLKKGLFTVSVVGIVMMCFVWIFAGTLANVFVGYDVELFEMTTHACKLFSFSFVLSGINIFASSFFTALNNGGVSAAISFMRTLLFQVICVLALPVFLGLDGIWLSIVIAEVLAFCVSSVFLIMNRKKYHYS